MKEGGLSRREFLKVASIFSAVYFLPQINFDLSLESEKKNPLIFKEIGPRIESYNKLRSPGERCGYIDPNNSEKIIVGTWDNGIWSTVNGGKDWKEEIVPALQKPSREKSVARDIVSIDAQGTLAISFDYSLAIGNPEKSDWKLIEMPDFWNDDRSSVQTTCSLPGGKILVGGNSNFPHSGLAIYDIKSEKWQSIDGFSSRESAFFIRTIQHLPSDNKTKPGKIYLGGWEETDGKDEKGTGLVCLDDQTFKIIESQSHLFQDKIGPMSVNTIKAFNYLGHDFVFVGGEGSGPKKDRVYDPQIPQLRILIDNLEVSSEVTNCKGLTKSGGWDLVTPQRGILFCSQTGEIFVSSGFKEVSRASIKNLLDGKEMQWERVTTAKAGQKDTGALHMGIGLNKSKSPVLMLCRGVFGEGNLPFMQTQIAEIV